MQNSSVQGSHIVRNLEQNLVLSPEETADLREKILQAGIQAVHSTHYPLIVDILNVFLLLQAVCELGLLSGINDLCSEHLNCARLWEERARCSEVKYL